MAKRIKKEKELFFHLRIYQTKGRQVTNTNHLETEKMTKTEFKKHMKDVMKSYPRNYFWEFVKSVPK